MSTTLAAGVRLDHHQLAPAARQPNRLALLWREPGAVGAQFAIELLHAALHDPARNCGVLGEREALRYRDRAPLGRAVKARGPAALGKPEQPAACAKPSQRLERLADARSGRRLERDRPRFALGEGGVEPGQARKQVFLSGCGARAAAPYPQPLHHLSVERERAWGVRPVPVEVAVGRQRVLRGAGRRGQIAILARRQSGSVCRADLRGLLGSQPGLDRLPDLPVAGRPAVNERPGGRLRARSNARRVQCPARSRTPARPARAPARSGTGSIRTRAS